jgi:uncharacterized protein (TIGR00255 family)
MTGFGRGENTGLHKQVTVEIKSVNHRYNEVLVKLPRQYTLLEENVRREVLKNVSRGRVEVKLNLENAGGDKIKVEVDKELALAYYKALKELATIVDMPLNLRPVEIAQMPDVMKVEETEENLDEIWRDVKPALEQALLVLLEMRKKEGEKLEADFKARIDYLHELHNKIEDRSPFVVSQYRDKLHSRLKEIINSGQVDENRVELEIALFADRSSIDEELTRLKSHFNQFIEALEEDSPVGRKLDFLIQEMHREVNTIGSKASDMEITRHVVEMKCELEKLREQVQNIE